MKKTILRLFLSITLKLRFRLPRLQKFLIPNKVGEWSLGLCIFVLATTAPAFFYGSLVVLPTGWTFMQATEQYPEAWNYPLTYILLAQLLHWVVITCACGHLFKACNQRIAEILYKG